MASKLKWVTGFDWGSVLLGTAGLLMFILLRGLGRWLGAAILLLVVAFMVSQFRKWNGRPWRRLHFRGMLLYANVCGTESAQAELAGRPFNIGSACRRLGLLLCGEDKADNVDAMISELSHEKGSYLAEVLRRHSHDLLPATRGAELESLLAKLSEQQFGPVLVICNVIENSHGDREAAEYVHALLVGDAH